VDRDIIRAARDGDPHARDLLGLWLEDELHGFFAKAFKQREQVGELIQDTVADIVHKLALAPDDPDAFRTFVRGFAGMQAHESTRDRKRERAHAAMLQAKHTPPAESASASLFDPLLAEEQRQLVIEHAQRMRPVYRTAILHVLDGGDYKSLAAAEGVSRKTASSRISYAIEVVGRSIERARRTRPPDR
jgi:DNA-directed RNA polymerase specialized sigma24 family protein